MASKQKGRSARSLRATARWLAQPTHWGSLVVVLLVLALLACCVFILPGFIVDLEKGQSSEPITAVDLLKAKNDVRTALIQAIGGLFFVATALFTWRQVRLKSDEQITDRFNKAIDHIGEDTRTDVRLGGIHALDRIARDSDRDRAAIVDILVAYIQARAPRKRLRPEDSQEDDERAKAVTEHSGTAHAARFLSLKARAPDVQAALNALGRPFLDTSGIFKIELQGVDFRFAQLRNSDFLSGADLSDADLTYANLAYANLSGANLSGARLWHADLSFAGLSDAWFSGTDLSNANLSHAKLGNAAFFKARLRGAKLLYANLLYANLSGANLLGANLAGADLSGASLAEATCWRTRLMRANLSGANLSGADLSESILSGANLEDANLSGTKATAKGVHATRWPEGFSREEALARGVIFVDEPEAEIRPTEGSQPSQAH